MTAIEPKGLLKGTQHHPQGNTQDPRPGTQDPRPHCCCRSAAIGCGRMLHSGQPITMLLRVSFNFSRRAAISAWNCSSVRNTRLPRSMNMLATDRLPDPLPIARIRHVLVRRRVVHVADDVEDGVLWEQRRRIIVVVVAADPVVIVADAVDGLDVVAPDGLEAHALTRSVQVRLERQDLGVLLSAARTHAAAGSAPSP